MVTCRSKIFDSLEKGTCAPNDHEQALVQMEEIKEKGIKNLLDARGGFGNTQGVPNTIKTVFEDLFRGRIN